MQGLLLGLGRGLLLPVLWGWQGEKKNEILKGNSKKKMLSLVASSDFSCSLSHLFHGTSWQPPANIQVLLCCCALANKVGSSGNQTGRKKNQHSTHLTPCISTQKMLSLAQVLSSLEITTQSSILLMLHTMLKILFPLQGSQLKINEMNYRWCRESSYSHFRNIQCWINFQ